MNQITKNILEKNIELINKAREQYELYKSNIWETPGNWFILYKGERIMLGDRQYSYKNFNTAYRTLARSLIVEDLTDFEYINFAQALMPSFSYQEILIDGVREIDNDTARQYNKQRLKDKKEKKMREKGARRVVEYDH